MTDPGLQRCPTCGLLVAVCQCDEEDYDYDQDSPRERVDCKYCGGDGMYDDSTPCPYCDGEGFEWWLE